ncbi:uncharacterized protein LOC123546205 [Mercenaria mercenaria]|uniref:uncharacterized protein LOC123546205 n=1 Tax=Mercenaria mercenaria TaxID=6596 RepID=UPI00234F52B6|nr:uncharacterized protein LOC123546205 [Mercenaria mercenaria]
MAVLILTLFVLRVVLVMSDVQCDCSVLTFIKQLVQQEMFERKLEISMLRADLQMISTAPGLIETDSSTGSAISTRVERLEQRFAEFKNASDTGQKTGAENPVQSEKSANNDNDGKHLSFQTLVKHALKNEKLERINFISQVQKQIETLKDIVSEFKTNTDIFVNEQTEKWSEDYEQFEKNISEQFSDFRESLQLSSQEHVRQITAGMKAIMDDVKQLEQNTSKKMDIFRESLRNDREEGNLRIQAVSNEIADNVTDIRENVRECITAIDLLKSGVNGITSTLSSSEEKVSQLHDQVEEHIKGAERRFSLVSRKVGTCHGANWERHGISLHSAFKLKLFGASKKCKVLNADLVEIESKEENDYNCYIFVLRVVLVMGDVQCDCSALTFIKQLVQQEMFERKLEISMIRDELRKNSPAPGLIKTDSSTGSLHSGGNTLKGRETVVAIVFQVKSGTCQRADWEHHGEKCYHFATQPINWFDASEKCKELNGDLVEIESKEENDYITVHSKIGNKKDYSLKCISLFNVNGPESRKDRYFINLTGDIVHREM